MALPSTGDPDAAAPTAGTFWRALLHRWLIEYNPLYLLSASLCLAGMILCSRGLAHEGSLHGELGVAAIAELYAGALIAGAALLTRIGQRRPAVMLALLTALYQCDLTLHTEASACLGVVGVVATAVWIVLFVSKLYALSWAVRVRPSPSAAALATCGAFGLGTLPHLLQRMDARGATTLVGVWLFVVFALGLYGSRSVVSKVDLDGWGTTVLRRCLRAIWLLWSLLLVLHVAFWSTSYPVRIAALLPVAILFAFRFVRRESSVWCGAIGTLLFIGSVMPEYVSLAALVVCAALAVRAVQRVRPAPRGDAAPLQSPYRALGSAPVVAAEPELTCPGPAAQRRLLTGALFSAYLAVWTLGFTGGPWPAHLVSLDLVLTVVVLVAAARARIRIALGPLAAVWGHVAVQLRLVSAPRSTLEWGATSVGLGFVLLIASLVASYRLRNPAAER